MRTLHFDFPQDHQQTRRLSVAALRSSVNVRRKNGIREFMRRRFDVKFFASPYYFARKPFQFEPFAAQQIVKQHMIEYIPTTVAALFILARMDLRIASIRAAA